LASEDHVVAHGDIVPHPTAVIGSLTWAFAEPVDRGRLVDNSIRVDFGQTRGNCGRIWPMSPRTGGPASRTAIPGRAGRPFPGL
jgi:hypothetical protein